MENDAQYQIALYRTRWLMAHNRLHDLAFIKSDNPKSATPRSPEHEHEFDDYLAELRTAEEVASKPA